MNRHHKRHISNMKTFKEILQKPSAAVEVMLDGLLEQSERPDFFVNMFRYGIYNDGLCFGCAAVCAVQKITGINFTDDRIECVVDRALYVGVDSKDLARFELAIDYFRQGQVSKLSEYFEIDLPDNAHAWSMSNVNWRREIPKVRAYLEKLKSMGL